MILFKVCAQEREIFGEIKERERKTTVSCLATIPKYIVEKILSQGGTGSTHPYRWAQLKRVRRFAPRANLTEQMTAIALIKSLNKKTS